MAFICTGDNTLKADLKHALFNPIPIENTLWFPNNIEKLSDEFKDKVP